MPALANRIAALERAAAAAPPAVTLASLAAELLPRLAERAQTQSAARALQGRVSEWIRVHLPLDDALIPYTRRVPDDEMKVLLEVLRECAESAPE
jgi:hypothetical protein